MPRKNHAPKLTDAFARAATCPPEKRNVVWTDAGGNLTLYVSPTAKLWRYRFRFDGGKPETITIGAVAHVNITAARAKVAEFERARNAGQHPRTLVTPERVPTVRDVLEHHLSTLKPANKRGVTSLYRDLLTAHGDKLVTAFTRHAAKNWIEANYAHRPGAARCLIRNVTAAFNKAKDSVSGLRLPRDYENPTAKLVQHITWLQSSPPGSLAVAWEDDEWRKVLEAIRYGYADPATHDAGPLCLELIAYTGARPSELQALTWAEIRTVKTEQGEFRAIVKEEHKTRRRTNKARTIPLSEAALDVLDRAEALRAELGYDGPYVFPTRRSQKNQKVGHVSRLTALAHRLGKAVGFDFVPYNFRSGYINHALTTLGYDKIGVVSENVGHSDVRTTFTYYVRQTASDRVKAAVEVGKAFAKLAQNSRSNERVASPTLNTANDNGEERRAEHARE